MNFHNKNYFSLESQEQRVFILCYIAALNSCNSSYQQLSLKCVCHSSLVRSVSSWSFQCSCGLMSQVMEEQAVYLPACQVEQLLFFSSLLYSIITTHHITNSFDHFETTLIDFKWKTVSSAFALMSCLCCVVVVDGCLLFVLFCCVFLFPESCS